MTYEEFAHARLAGLSRYALMLTGDPHSAQDLVQETMVRVQLNWRKVVRADSPERYVRRMMTNVYIDWRRSSWLRRVQLRSEHPEPAVEETDPAQRTADRDLMWSVLATLPRQQRAALVLRFYEDLSDPDIADALGCSVSAARGYVSKALSALRAKAMPELTPGGPR